MSIIEVHQLSKTFKTRERAAGFAGSLRSFVAPQYRQREAVKSISFSLERGEVLAFIGPNGAGKSTTIKMLTGILHPSRGSAQVLGLTPWKKSLNSANKFASAYEKNPSLCNHFPRKKTSTRLPAFYKRNRKNT